MNNVANIYDIAGYICEVSKYDKTNAAFSANSVSLAKAFIDQIGDVNEFVRINTSTTNKVASSRVTSYSGFDTDSKTEAFFNANKAACLELMQEILSEKEHADCNAYISSIVPNIFDEAQMFTGYICLVNEQDDEIKDDEIINLRRTFVSGFVRDLYNRVHHAFWLQDRAW